MQREVYEFISKKTNPGATTVAGDPIVEWKTCKVSGQEFPIYKRERELLDQISPTIGWEKFLIPSPDCCYRVRMLRRLSFRNEKKFYQVTCANTGKKEISIVHDTVRNVMSPKDWNEEDFWKYAIPYSGDFFQDIKTLFEKVPYMPRFVVNSENSEYCNQARDEKNCYLCVGGENSENCMYDTHDMQSKYAFDCYGVIKTEIAYQSIHIYYSMKSFFSIYLISCYNVWFGYDCKNCKNVLFGTGLVWGEYVFKNKIYPKEEREHIFKTYSQKMKTISWLQEVLQEYDDFVNQHPHEAIHNINSEHSFGAQINDSKNMILWFAIIATDDSFYCATQGFSKNVMDAESSSNSELIFNCVGSLRLFGSMCIAWNFSELRHSAYDFYTRGGNNLLGCFGVNNKSYCILNKEYSKDEREQLATTIIHELQSKGKRGEFFDTELSPFPYNDTLANKFFPVRPEQLTILQPEKFISDAILDLWGEEKLKIKRRTRESELNIPENAELVQAKDLPDNIDDVDVSILDKVIICEKTWRPFKIMKLELEFYKQYGLPLPTTHYEYRDEQRYDTSIPKRLLEFCLCDKCGKETLSELRKGHTYKVYCEGCYAKEIYW